MEEMQLVRPTVEWRLKVIVVSNDVMRGAVVEMPDTTKQFNDVFVETVLASEVDRLLTVRPREEVLQNTQR